MVRAVLLAGGLGTRLHPLTETLPKPMIPVLGRPWLERLVEHLTLQGVGEIILSLRHGKDVIIRHFEAPGRSGMRDAGPRVRFCVEPVPLGTGGAIRYAAWPAQDTVVVFNADVVQAFDLAPFLAFHRARGADVTIGLVEVEDPSAYGAVELGGDGRVRRFVEKPGPGEVAARLVNAGIYAFEPAALAEIPEGREVSVEREVFPALVGRGRNVFGYAFDGYWLDLGTRDRYLQLHADILRGRCPIRPQGELRAPGVWVEGRADIAAGAVIKAPVALGRGTVVAPGARVGPYVVTGRGCRIGADTRVRRSVLWDGAEVHREAQVNGCVLGTGARVGGGVLEDALVAAGRWSA